ncbi:MAG TPA: rod shape-determining protein MreC, partial [Accumulibacter sp.]|nr:rod shape-determining protein MreC [Accumulibacter sp.]
MDHQPPPFFKRGPAPLALLTFYVALSLALLIADARLQMLEMLRQGVSLFTHPVQNLAHLPGQWIDQFGTYFVSLTRLQEENSQLKRTRLDNVATLLRTQHLEIENQRLRRLLELKERQAAKGQMAQILYSVRDPYSRRIVIDKGLQDHVQAGQPVIDDAGIVGQVTRVFPFVAEITLLTDKEQSVPVQIVRTGQPFVVRLELTNNLNTPFPGASVILTLPESLALADPPFVGTPPDGTTYDPEGRTLFFDGTIPPGGLAIDLAASLDPGASCGLTLSMNG